ncbi:MAG TPA: hypothetical protein VKV20_19925 [Ktedonobacteraceae bacterium]|nr:hypothetical protein [Ktedonobacteraceae bacterium]
MQEALVAPLDSWQNFYVIIGSAAAALTGLMFVVITLIAGTRARRSGGAVAAYGTPNVVHFCAALFITAVLSAPWPALWNASLLLGLLGVCGVAYVLIVLRRTLRQTDYKPVLEDWLGHIIGPFTAYAALFVAAAVLPHEPVPTMFVIGGATVLLLFIGIHNAWDTVTYITFDIAQRDDKGQD